MSERIYHITTEDKWATATRDGRYTPMEYIADGFLHAAFYPQIESIANFIFSAHDKLLVLEIDTDKIGCELKVENTTGGSEQFPHIYGSLPTSAVTRTFVISRFGDKGFVVPKQK